LSDSMRANDRPAVGRFWALDGDILAAGILACSTTCIPGMHWNHVFAPIVLGLLAKCAAKFREFVRRCGGARKIARSLSVMINASELLEPRGIVRQLWGRTCAGSALRSTGSGSAGFHLISCCDPARPSPHGRHNACALTQDRSHRQRHNRDIASRRPVAQLAKGLATRNQQVFHLPLDARLCPAAPARLVLNGHHGVETTTAEFRHRDESANDLLSSLQSSIPMRAGPGSQGDPPFRVTDPQHPK